MPFAIQNHRLVGVPFRASPNCGGRIEPALIVVHDTADRLRPDDTISWFGNPKARVSAHFVVARDGSVTQMVPCDREAWHAGKSSWEGRASCNRFAVGIEIDNPGKLTRVGNHAVAWFGGKFPLTDCVEMASTAHGNGWWHRYTDAQLATVRALIEAIAAAYPTITDVASHWEISPGRKVDTGPHFPLNEMKRLVAGRWVLSRIEVERAQKRLDALGYWPGPLDGLIGPKTRSAVRDFQEQNDLPILAGRERPDGGLDEATWERLFAEEAVAMPAGSVEPGAAVVAAKTSGREATLVQRVSELASGLTIAEALVQISEGLKTAETAKSVGIKIGDLLSWLLTPKGLGTAATLAVCLVVWVLANRIAGRTA